jgi:hypothetical protein
MIRKRRYTRRSHGDWDFSLIDLLYLNHSIIEVICSTMSELGANKQVLLTRMNRVRQQYVDLGSMYAVELIDILISSVESDGTTNS